MSNNKQNNKNTETRDNDKVGPPGGPSNSTTNTIASSAVVVNLEEQFATEIPGQGEPKSSSSDVMKDVQKKRPASEVNNDEQSDEPAKKAKTSTGEPIETVKNPPTPSTIPGRIASDSPLKGTNDLRTRRRRTNRSRRVPESQGKHEPYTKPGTKFTWADNGHVDTTQSKTGPEDRSRYKLILKDTNGNKVPYLYTRRKVMDWNSKKDVAHLNTWRNQIIKRKLDENDGTSRNTEYRPHWSEKEKVSVETLVRDRIRKKRRQLVSADWITIAEKHNARFRGKTIHVGEWLPGAITNKGKFAEGRVLKKAHVLNDRTPNAIRSQTTRWPDTADMIQEELRKLGIAETEESEKIDDSKGESEEVEEEGEGEDSGDDSDLGLDDPSDDEDDGHRPASTQTGGRLISTGA